MVSRDLCKRLHIRVTGTVQGVFYRASAREVAAKLGLSGWVRNTPDGAVEIEAEGPAEKLDELVAWCRRGPRLADVRAVEVNELSPIGDDSGFRIEY